MSTAEALLAVRGVGKAFGGLVALSQVGFDLVRGEILGLIGPNGAGKTTLFNILTGLTRADQGQTRLAGRPITGLSPHAVAHAGLARTFQNIRLFANMTALENIMVGRHVRTRTGVLGAVLRTPRARREEWAIAARAAELLDYVGLAGRGDDVAGQLPYGDQRRLEIARALATDPQLLALDEPAAGMNATESATLANLLRRIRDDGTTLLIIEHDMPLVMKLCDRVVVLDHGVKIADGSPEAVRRDERVIEAYLGVGGAGGAGAG